VLIVVKRLIMIVLIVATCPQPARAQPPDRLAEFDAAPYVLGQLQQRRAIERGEMAVATAKAIVGYLSKPDGDPFPAVIYLHGCSGLSTAARKRFSNLLTAWGYVSLAVDSFTSRGIEEACDRPMPDRQADAWGAMLYLSKLPFVDRERVALVGSSQGNIVALRLASTHDVKVFDIPDGLNFKAVIAFYPVCSVASEQLALPTLILFGELDDWTPAKNCEQWIGLRNGRAATVKLVVYPGAYHAFDFPELASGLGRYGHRLKYNAEAAQGSAAEMRDFLAAHLSK
jgi:dienelactone hydrolase